MGRPRCSAYRRPNPETCIDNPCPGATAPSGQNLDLCGAIHAEQNCLLQCNPVELETLFCTTSPCMSCMKLIAGTKCQRIVFLEEYPHPEAREYALKLGMEWCHIDRTDNPVCTVMKKTICEILGALDDAEDLPPF